ncbi:MAG TPA: protein kinase, partial [Ktedonobacterales bacterium]|nr:protein kinase [Ktedonobacterales bacterium]
MTTGSAGSLIGQSLGEYRLTALLGAGGMAEVYRALDVSLNREVAVKVLPPSLANDPDYVLRFRNEARHVAALNHPNIVPVFTYGEESDLLYLVMPILRESLRERMERERVMAPHDAIRVCIQVAAALDVAHSQGIVHRDVKPENILLDDDGRALLTDFGIAREASALRQPNTMRTLAGTGLPVGTVEYMAPEQLSGDLVDHRADVYALGVVLYEMLAGVLPHIAATPYKVAAMVLTEPVIPPSTHNPTIWPGLEQVVLKAMASEPSGRYPSARGFALAARGAATAQSEHVVRLTVPATWQEIEDPLMTPGVPGAPGASLGPVSAIITAPVMTLGEEPTVPISPWESWDQPAARGPLPPPSLPSLPRISGWRDAFRPGRTSARAWLAAASLVVLLVLGLLAGTGIAILHSFNQPPQTTGFGTPGTAGQIGGQPGSATASPVKTPGTPLPGPAATAAAQATETAAVPTATSSAQPTATTAPAPSPTIDPSPPLLSLDPASSITLTKPAGSNFCMTSTPSQAPGVSQTISNSGGATRGWSYQGLTPGF